MLWGFVGSSVGGYTALSLMMILKVIGVALGEAEDAESQGSLRNLTRFWTRSSRGCL